MCPRILSANCQSFSSKPRFAPLLSFLAFLPFPCLAMAPNAPLGLPRFFRPCQRPDRRDYVLKYRTFIWLLYSSSLAERP